MAKSDLDKDSLKIGDYIVLNDALLGCFLGVEGIILEDIVGADSISNLHDCIFCVHLQRQYSASRELNAFLEKYNMDVKNITDESELRYLAALQRGQENENKLNDNYMRKKLGQVVLFGDVIQLFHVKSGKYLEVLPSKLAKEERENVRIGLDVNGSMFSWIQICPRFKIDKDGDRILSNVEAYLRLVEKPTEFVHLAQHEPPPGQEREVNCSLEQTSWRITIFQSSTDAVDNTLLMASQLVYIHDPETRSNLALADKKPESFGEEDDGKVTAFSQEGSEEDLSGENDAENEEESVVLRPAGSTSYIDSNFLWILEASSILAGGPIKWKTDQVRFKHLNSGLYLCQYSKHGVDDDGIPTKSWYYSTASDANASGTLFSIHELNSTAKFLCSGKASQIGHGSVLVERGPILPDSLYSFKLQGTKDKSAAVSLVVNYYFGHGVGPSGEGAGAAAAAKKKKQAGGGDHGDDGGDGGVGGGAEGEGDGAGSDDEGDSAVTAGQTANQPLDVFAGLSARTYLEKYDNMTVLSTNSNTIWPNGSRTDMDLFKMIVSRTVIFTQGFPISATNVKIGIDKSDPELRRRRQNLLREQNTLEIVLRLIKKLIPLSEAAVERPTAANVDASFLTKMGRTVLEQCFTVLYNALQDNQENQMYVADFMPVLLAHLNTQPMAVKCVTEMLSKNIELQETKIGTREIQIFVDKLRSSKMNAMYLQLLQACCSCEGKGVDGNQCKVATMLFDGDTSDIIVTLEANYQRLRKAAWGGDNVLYLSPPGGSDAKVIGYDLYLRGLPQLTLRWQRNGEPITSALEDIFVPPPTAPALGGGLAAMSSDDHHDDKGQVEAKPPSLSHQASFKSHSFKARSGNSETLARVGAYFIAEMFLGAEMCMDRNYVAINQLKDLFTYEKLVSILAIDSLSSSVKSAAVRLLMCLHVDRDPQAATKIPLLTRSWSDIKKNPEPQLPYVDPHRRYDFGLIQQLLSEHIKGMAGRRWDELSRHMLKMLLTLVRFNFYGTNERMKDVIAPLIMALDRRGLDLATGELPPGMGVSQKFNASSSETPVGGIAPAVSQNDSFEESESFNKDANEGYGTADGDNISELSSQADLRYSVKAKARREQFQSLLNTLDSHRCFQLMMTLVALDVAVDIYHLVTHASFAFPSVIFLIEAATMAVFAVEIGLRMLCVYSIEGSVASIFLDVFNICDVVAVGLNIAFLLVTPLIESGAGLVIALRFVKAYRMIQMTSARIVAGNEEDVKADALKVTARYTVAPIHELETMVEVVDILAFMQRVIEDRNISLAMHYFYAWENNSDRRSPSELFEQVVQDSKQLSLNLADFDNIMLDVLMFVHRPLTQSTLEVLMAHHSMRKTLLDNVERVQLLASAKREKQYREVKAMLEELEQNAETHELWGELESDEDHATNERTKGILQKLIEICRVRHFVLEFDEDYMADSEIQDLYRNLGCFEICMKVMNLLESVDEEEDGTLSEVALNTRDICLQCNTLLYWYFLGNAKNQEQGYKELELFLDTLDDEINSHLVVGAIFKGNAPLMRLNPHSNLEDLLQRIMKNGKSHHYLALFANISNVGELNIPENQFMIVKLLTAPGTLQNISCFFCPMDSPEYEEKRKLMEPFLGQSQDLTYDDVPPLLAYHLMFLDVLSDCTVGRLNLSTVEAKVQSVFNYVDIVQSILDPGTILFTQIRLSMFFFNSIIEVELKIPGLEQSACVWQLLRSYEGVLGYAKDELRQVEKAGWESPDVSRQRIEYIIVCIWITGGFFSRYYDPNTFRFTEAGANAPPSDRVQISQAQVNDLIKSLFDKVKDVYDLDSPRLSTEMKASIFTALEALNKSASKIIVNNLQPTNVRLQATTAPGTMSGESILVQKFKSFQAAIKADEALMLRNDNENVNFINILENLPKIGDQGAADVRYETLIRKLVQHIRDNFIYVNNQKRLDARVTKTSTWIIRAFRTMIENKMGMSIFERDDDGGAEEDEAAEPVVTALNTCGATTLVLDLIAPGIDAELQLEAVKLGVGLLFKEGGALEVQKLMHAHLSKTNSTMFFEQVKATIKALKEWHTWNADMRVPEDEEPDHKPEILLVRFLQLMCEGHFLPNQDIMRDQPNNPITYNLLDDFVDYFNCLSRIPCRTSTTAAIRLSATILEVIQGPCEGNQAHFALNTELIETLNRVNRAKVTDDCKEEEEIALKKTCIDIFQGLLEGQGEKSPVYERVLSVIHLDIIQMMSKGTTFSDAVTKGGKLVVQQSTEDQVTLQTECVVLLQMLCNFKPSLYEELGISKNIDDIVGSGTAMIEVVWRGDIHRRFFHVPAICEYLAKSSKDALVENVDRSNAENKLIDFLARSHDLYREVKHQQWLTDKKLSTIFSLKTQNIATWITFGVAVLINILFVAYYTYAAGDDRPSVTSFAALNVINAFNIFQNVVGFFVIVLNGVVRSPVIYQKHLAEGLDTWTAALFTAGDAKTVYFCGYLVLSLLGLLAADYYLPFLLLDLVAKNATTRDVLNAVIIPRKQLGMTVVLAAFVTYIFAYFLFKYFPGDLGGLMGDGVYPGEPDCKTLWGCFKFVVCYGVRAGGGVGEFLKLTVGPRWLIDAAFFVVIAVMLLNIVFGIIIDTFGSLRNEMNERIEDTVGVCFICGISDQVFDRASDEPDGFKTHVKLDHNMWNYLYFIFMLWEQDKDDDDGLEQYVRRAIDANEITWFPINKAIRLEQAATEEEITLREISTEIRTFEEALEKKIIQFQTEMSVLLDTVSQATKIEHAKGNVKDGIAGFIRRSLIVIAPAEDGGELSEMGAGSVVLDTIDEDASALDDGSIAEESVDASAHGLGIVHEASDDEDSDFEDDDRDDLLRRNTASNSIISGGMEGFEENSVVTDTAEPPPSQPAPFPGTAGAMEVNSVVGGAPVIIREMSDRFWGIDGTQGSVPSTPASSSSPSRPSIGEKQMSHRLSTPPDTAVERIDEEVHHEVEGPATERDRSEHGSAPTTGRDYVPAVTDLEMGEPVPEDGEGIAMVPVTPWDAPLTAAATTRPATHSEEVRPDTAAHPVDSGVTGTRASTAALDASRDMVVPATVAEEQPDGAPVEQDLTVRPVTGPEATGAETEEHPQSIETEEHSQSVETEEHPQPVETEEENTAATSDSAQEPAPAAKLEEEGALANPEVEGADQAASQEEPHHVTLEQDHEQDQPHDRVQGVDKTTSAENVPGSGPAAVEYLAGASFRVSHVLDQDSISVASGLNEPSLTEGAELHPDRGAAMGEAAEPAVEAAVPNAESQAEVTAEGSALRDSPSLAIWDLPLGMEESVLSAQMEASLVVDVEQPGSGPVAEPAVPGPSAELERDPAHSVDADAAPVEQPEEVGRADASQLVLGSPKPEMPAVAVTEGAAEVSVEAEEPIMVDTAAGTTSEEAEEPSAASGPPVDGDGDLHQTKDEPSQPAEETGAVQPSVPAELTEESQPSAQQEDQANGANDAGDDVDFDALDSAIGDD